jgi:hypothetical protein
MNEKTRGHERNFFIGIVAGALAFGLAILLGLAWGSSTRPAQWDGSRVTPVHQIPLKDEFGLTIVPTERNPLPFSARTTCAPCHDYEIIRQGWHFNAGPSDPAGRPGEPWVLVDPRTGTQIPLSFRPWKGSFTLADLGLSAWDFTLLFGRHLPGGGLAEPVEAEMAPGSRWNVSGKVEINCLGCHNARPVQNPSEWAKQILRENFRWAATAAAGLGEVGGMSSRLAPTWDIFDGPNPDDSEWAVAPSVRYDKTLFDIKHRAFLDIAAKPDDARCLACHAAAPAAVRKFEFDEDVHTAAGLRCVSCHRHDVSHAMIRGYEGEGRDNPAVLSEDFTCRGCHLGGRSSNRKDIIPGRLGAPYPRHFGLPKVHLDRLACTACHSGPLPAREPERVRTSRANRLGIYGIANWVTEMPAIVEPVFIREANGKLTPHRLFWPAYWAKSSGGKVAPLRPEDVQAAAGDVLFPEKAVTRILAALFNTVDLVGTPVLLMDGKMYERNVDGGLDAAAFAAAKPGEMAWAVKKDGVVIPLIPDFDPLNPEAAAEPEIFIQKVLEALRMTAAASGEPVLVHQGFQYKIVEAQVEKTESKEDAAARGQLFWLKDGERRPFVPEFEKRTIAALANAVETLTEEQVRLVLEALGRKGKSEGGAPEAFVYIAGGKLFRLGAGGSLVSRNHQAAEPVAWPLAHEVRPAQQSLGVNGCPDCHRATSSFFFAEVRGRGPLQTRSVMLRPATAFMRLTAPYHLLFGTTFAVRPYFKVVLGVAVFALGSVLFAAFLLAVGRAAGLVEKRR